VDIVVKGRHMDVSERFRGIAQEKLAKVEKLDPGMQRVDVELSKEPNPRLADRAYRVELTCRSRGPVIRAEAAATDKLAALDVAWGRLEARLRKAADRRVDRKKHAQGVAASTAAVTAAAAGAARNGSGADGAATDGAATDDGLPDGSQWQVSDEGPMVVRVKTHVTDPMSLDQALYEMELVGHDFFLFVDAGTDRPSVVYRRRAYDYGVIHLEQPSSA
jgi:ribosomal subunit interface protein